ncbi:MAG: glycosyltransferase involved in cell wall biosynthesis [Rickettsiales bacterium]|jgi:glycosyltransferase involved in cell wall biosynthesis
MIQSNAVGGGMENIFLEYSKILQKNNFEIICLVPKQFCHNQELKNHNIKIEFINVKGHLDLLAAIKINFLIRKYSPQLILAHSGRVLSIIDFCQRIFGLKKTKIIAVAHGGNVKRIIKSDFVITVAKHLYDKIVEAGFKSKAVNIYNGYQTSSFDKIPSPQSFTFGTLSRLSKEKNISSAIYAFKKFHDEVNKDCLLMVGGEGIEMDNLKSLARELNLEFKINFTGWTSNKENFFNSLNVFLQPALNEPFGMTILESFNYKTVVIGANSDGPKEIINDNESGYLFDPNLENSLFLTMKKAFVEKEKQSQIAANASKDLQEKFSYENMEKNLTSFISNISQNS